MSLYNIEVSQINTYFYILLLCCLHCMSYHLMVLNQVTLNKEIRIAIKQIGSNISTLQRSSSPLAGAVRPHALGELDALADVHHHGTRAAVRGDRERLAQHPVQVPHVLDQVVVLGDGPGDADHV